MAMQHTALTHLVSGVLGLPKYLLGLVVTVVLKLHAALGHLLGFQK